MDNLWITEASYLHPEPLSGHASTAFERAKLLADTTATSVVDQLRSAAKRAHFRPKRAARGHESLAFGAVRDGWDSERHPDKGREGWRQRAPHSNNLLPNDTVL